MIKIGEMAGKSRQEIRSFISIFTGSEGINPEDYGIQNPRSQYGLTDSDIEYFKYRDPEIKSAVDKFMKMDFPVHTIDDFLIVEIAGMVAHLGVDGAVSKAREWPRRLRSLMRCVARNHKKRRN